MNDTQIHQAPPLILVADDDDLIRLTLRKLLEKEGYRVVEACDGHECLAAYQNNQPNIVLLDVEMPGMNGLDCCALLQTIPGSEHTPILMLTGFEDKASVERAFESGATDYIIKPIHCAVLRRRLRILIEKSQLYRELEQANHKLQHLACVDGLTQVSNRRYFEEHLSRKWQQMAREQAPLSLLLCDVDFFKLYNDTYGHPAGDDCLRAVAGAIARSVQRPASLVARYGGEEFAVILPNTEASNAADIAEKIRSEVKALKIAHANSRASAYVTLSQGIASIVPSHESSAQSLIAAADRALYRAKAEGRDRWFFVSYQLSANKKQQLVCEASQ